MKICIKCKTEKSKNEFHKDRLRKDGLCPYCRECRRTKKRLIRKAKYPHSNGYILLYMPSHPLAQKSTGLVYEHRYIFHLHFKGEELSCEFCGAPWMWRTYKDHIDHIDEIKSNNNIENLRALCNSCNVARTRKIHCHTSGNMAIEYDGKTLTAEEWGREPGVKVPGYTVRCRIKAGWTVYDSLFKDSRKKRVGIESLFVTQD